jgi:hypothetical protein
MWNDAEIVLSETSPNRRWTLTVYTAPGSAYYLADICNIDNTVGCCSRLLGASFGQSPRWSATDVSVRWDLPDNVLGLFVGAECFGLFRCGAGRRRSRGQFRCGLKGFSTDEIDWFCAKTHTQFKRSTIIKDVSTET